MDVAGLPCRLVRHFSFSDVQPERFAVDRPAAHRHSCVFHRLCGVSRATDVIILLAGVTLGKDPPSFYYGATKAEETIRELSDRQSAIVHFLVGLVLLLAFSSWWHLDMSNNFYHGPRWMGLWDNPNTYGMLMGAGVVLAIGLLAENLKSEKLKAETNQKSGKRKAESFASLRSFAANKMSDRSFYCGGDDGGRVVV